MAITITANSNNITSQVRPDSFVREQNITSKIDTCRFTYRKYGSRTYVPAVGHEVTVVDGATDIFAGKIVDITKRVVGKDILVFEIQCNDWTYLADQKLYVDSHTNETAKDIVDNIVANLASLGITGTNVAASADDFTIEFLQFDYARTSDALREIADMIGYDWWIDYDKDLHFVPKGTTSAPFNLDDTGGKYNYRSLILRDSDKQIKNTIYIMGADYVGASTTDKVGTGDGNQKRFPLPYKYDQKPTLTVGGVSKTVGIDFIDNPASFDALWNFQEKVMNFATAPASGAVEVTGLPLIPLLLKLTAPGSVGTKGAYEFKIVDKTLKTQDAVRKRAQAELDAYAESITEAEFTTKESGLQAGQRITVQSTIRGIASTQYVIQQVSTRMRTNDTFTHKVKLANVKAYEIVEFLRHLLLIGEKTLGIIRDASSILNLILSLSTTDTVTVQETFDVNGGTLGLKKNLQIDVVNPISDTLLAGSGTNSPPTWVWGTYAPVSDADRNRPPDWSRGALWA